MGLLVQRALWHSCYWPECELLENFMRANTLIKRHRTRFSLIMGELSHIRGCAISWVKVTNINSVCVSVYLCKGDSVCVMSDQGWQSNPQPRGAVCWWRLLTHSYTQNTSVCSCRKCSTNIWADTSEVVMQEFRCGQSRWCLLKQCWSHYLK